MISTKIKSEVFIWVFWRKITKVRVSCETFAKNSAGAPGHQDPGEAPERARPEGEAENNMMETT